MKCKTRFIRRPLKPCRPHHRQIHSGHHAPGQWRRWRRAAHQPIVLDVLPQDHRRSGSGTRTDPGRLSLADPARASMAQLGGGPGGHHRAGAARFRQRRTVSGAEEPAAFGQARRPPPRRARRVRGRIQLHEIRPVDAAGGQQDQRVDFNNLAERQHFGDILRAIPQRSAIGGKCGRILHAARCHRLYGRPHRSASGRNLVRSRLRHGRVSHLRHPSHGEALRPNARAARDDAGRLARGGEEAASPHALRHQHAAARHRRSELRAPRQHAGPAAYFIGARTSASISSSPIRPSAGARKTASKTIFRPSAPRKRPICSSP